MSFACAAEASQRLWPEVAIAMLQRCFLALKGVDIERRALDGRDTLSSNSMAGAGDPCRYVA